MKIDARRGALVAAAAALLVPAGAVQAQTAESPKEFGIDAGVAFGLGDENTISVGIPSSIRVGFFSSPAVSVEPYGGLTYEDNGTNDATTLNIGTGLLYHFTPPRAGATLYVRPFVDVLYVSGTEDNTRFGFGAGIGHKIPWRDRFGTRIELNLGYRTDPGEAVIGVAAGLSFYTK